MTRAVIALAGCGAVAHEYYLPALTAQSDRMRIAGFFDPDANQAGSMAAHFHGAVAASSLDDLLRLKPDLLIAASPPMFHAGQVIAALSSGANVLCEKPMALDPGDARRMMLAARENSRMLAIGMTRRYFPSSRIAGQFIRSGALGDLRAISAFEGGDFRWPIRDQRYFSQEVSGGGVVADVGTHVLDLLYSWFGEPEFVRYEDDAMGGVEANALMTLRYANAPATIRLSRDWERPNHIELSFEKGSIRWSANDIAAIDLNFGTAHTALRVVDETAIGADFITCLGLQIEAALDHIAGRPANIIEAAEALSTIALVDRAYRERRTLQMPWLDPMERGHG